MSAAKPVGLRAVFDTNVYFSALTHTTGVPFRIWQAAIKQRFMLITSPIIMRELAEVLRLDLHWPEHQIIRQLKLLSRVAEIVVPKTELAVVKNDPDDDRILECAMDGKADLIVSGDQHLLRLKSFRGIGILRPVDFQRTLGSRSLI